MIRIESLRDYLGANQQTEFMELAQQIGQIVARQAEAYPGHAEWFWEKQLPGVTGPERKILFVRDEKDADEIIALACLKKDAVERKICHLYVDEAYRGQGIGSTLVADAMSWLGTTKPLITLSEDKLPLFAPMIKKYHWKLMDSVDGIYQADTRELCFNGSLIQKQTTAKKHKHKLSKLVGFAKATTQEPDLTR